MSLTKGIEVLFKESAMVALVPLRWREDDKPIQVGCTQTRKDVGNQISLSNFARRETSFPNQPPALRFALVE